MNKTAVRRLDLVELLADLGLGQGMHSIIGQGKVEAILASKPEERRALIEEAAGLGRFKARRHRAELKLARVATQVERARDLEEEVQEAAAPARAAGDRGRARREAARRDREAARAHRRARPRDARRAARRGRRAQDRGRARAARRRGEARGGARRARRRRGGARRRGRQARAGDAGALPAAQRGRAARAPARVGDGARSSRCGPSSPTRRPTPATRPSRSRELERRALEAAEAARVAAVEREARAERARQALARAARGRARAARRDAGAARRAARAPRRRSKHELTGAAGERESALVGLLRAAQPRGAARGAARVGDAADRAARAELAEAEADAARRGPSPEELEQQALYARAAARDAAHERDTLAERALTAQERLATLERSLAEREGIPPAARALAEEGERLALSLLDGRARDASARSRPRSAPRASALVAPTAKAALELLERAAAAGLGSLRVLAGRDPRELVDELPVVEKDELLDVDGARRHARGLRLRPAARRALVRRRDRRGGAARARGAPRVRSPTRRRRSPSRRGSPSAPPTSRDEQAAEAEAAFAAAAPRLRIRRADVGTLKALLAAASRLERALEALDGAVDVVEAPLRARGEAGAERTAALGATLRELGEQESALRRALRRARRRRASRPSATSSRLGGTVAPVDGGRRRRHGDSCAMATRTLVAAADAAAATAAELGEQARAAEAARIDAAVRAGRRRARPHQLARVLAGAERLDATLARRGDAAARFEAPLRAHVDAGGARTGELGEELRRLGAAEVELRQALTSASASVSAIDVEVARIEAEADEARRRLEHAGTDERAEGDDRDELAERAERLERRRESLGQVNPLAKEEYDAEKARLDELATQRKDLERASPSSRSCAPS